MDTAQGRHNDWLMPERDDPTAPENLSPASSPPVSSRPSWLNAAAVAGVGLVLGVGVVLAGGHPSSSDDTATRPPAVNVQQGGAPTGILPRDADELVDDGSGR